MNQETSLLTPTLLLQHKSIRGQSRQPIKKVLMGFYPNADQALLEGKAKRTWTPLSNKFPFVEFDHQGEPMLFIYPGMGAPLAAACLEIALAMGARQVLYCGTAGSLTADFKRGQLLLVNEALRDEGTSRHYLDHEDEQVVNASKFSDFVYNQLLERGLPVRSGKTWTTDAIFRETQTKIQWAQNKGCAAVDMESAALIAVAQMYNIEIAGLLIGADALWGPCWQPAPEALKHAYNHPKAFLKLGLEILSAFSG